jgi:hypothetical protein
MAILIWERIGGQVFKRLSPYVKIVDFHFENQIENLKGSH